MATSEDAPLGCAEGFHDIAVAGEPVDDGDSVTIDYTCPRCGRVVWTERWTKATWQARQAGRTRPE